MQSLSSRLLAIADTVKKCELAVDIGTDHAYIPIYLCKNNIVKNCIAGDISKGSAQKAENNVNANGLNDRISVRCGSGLKIITSRDRVDCVIIAGMGGMLMLDILDQGELGEVKQLILQPQKDIPAVRRALHEKGFLIEDEKAVLEDEKFYNIISAVHGIDEKYTETEYEFGKILLEKKDTVLKQYIKTETERLKKLLPKVNEKRRTEIEHMLKIYGEGSKCL